MKEFALRASVGAGNITGLAISRMRGLARNERGSVVETVIVIAIMVLAAVVIFGLIFNALKEQGTKISDCISGVNTNGSCTGFK